MIPNFICLKDIEPRDEALRSSFVNDGEKLLIHVSNFRKVKRVEDVVKIFAQVKEKVPAKLVLVGDGPERHHIEEMCRNNKDCNEVIFVGKMKDTHHLMAAADLFLLTSEFESFGLVALESMGNKTPVISTNKGGIPEVMKDGVSGYMFDVGDVDGMAAKAIEVLSDDDRLNALRESAFEHSKNFELSKILPIYLDLYKRTISR